MVKTFIDQIWLYRRISNIFHKVKHKSSLCQSHMEDCNWEDRLVETSIDVNWAIITYFLQWVSTVLVERCQQTKHLQSWWFCILNLNWFHQGCFLASDFIYGAYSIRQWHQHLNKTFIFLFWQTNYLRPLSPSSNSWCILNLRRSCQEQKLIWEKSFTID